MPATAEVTCTVMVQLPEGPAGTAPEVTPKLPPPATVVPLKVTPVQVPAVVSGEALTRLAG